MITDPIITNETNTHNGMIFDPAEDGAFSEYLFGSTTPWDLENGLADEGFLHDQIGVFKFEDLFLGGDVIFNTTNGPVDVALVATNSIDSDLFPTDVFTTNVAEYGYWDLSTIRGLMFAAQNGPITLGNYITFSDGTLGEGGQPGPGADIYVYGRSANSTIDYYASTYLSGNLYLVSLADVYFSANINVENFFVNSGGKIYGNFYENSTYAEGLIEMTAENGIELNGEYYAQNIDLFSPSAILLQYAYLSADFVSIVGDTVQVDNAYLNSYHPDAAPANPPENIRIRSTATTGTGITVTNSSMLTAIANASAQGGNILLQTEGAGIQVLNSSTIKSEGGQVSILSKGGNIDIADSTIQSKLDDNETLSGQVLIDTNPSSVASVVNLTNATLAADAVRVRAYGNGAALNIAGGSITAGSLMHLYAEGAGGNLRFTGNTSLSFANSGVLAAESVTVNNGVLVNVSSGNESKIKIYANNHNYSGYNSGNGSTSGEFTGNGAPGTGETPEPYANRPGF